MRFIFVFMVTCIVFLCSANALSDGKTLYKKCRGCHGVDGKHVPFERPSGVIAGRDKQELELIIKAMYDGNYKDGKINTIMKKVILKFNEDEISLVSDYISKFKK